MLKLVETVALRDYRRAVETTAQRGAPHGAAFSAIVAGADKDERLSAGAKKFVRDWCAAATARPEAERPAIQSESAPAAAGGE
jgi:hypothetical protein